MHWHKRPAQPALATAAPDPAILNIVQESFLFAHCTKVTGAICLDDDTNLCHKCYSRIRVSLIHERYRSMRTHFFINSHVVRNEFCFKCNTTVIRTRPISECISCALTARSFLKTLHDTSTHIDECEYPLVLNVVNRVFF